MHLQSRINNANKCSYVCEVCFRSLHLERDRAKVCCVFLPDPIHRPHAREPLTLGSYFLAGVYILLHTYVSTNTAHSTLFYVNLKPDMQSICNLL